jgi:hypothetical protein
MSAERKRSKSGGGLGIGGMTPDSGAGRRRNTDANSGSNGSLLTKGVNAPPEGTAES